MLNSYKLMNHSAVRSAVFLCVLLSVVAVSVPATGEEAARPKLVFTTFPSEGMGMLFERILTEAYDRIGYDIVIQRVPAQRALVMANSGSVDGEAGRVPVIEFLNPHLVRVPTPIYNNSIVVFTKRTDIDTSRKWEAIEPFTMASVLGYKYIEKQTRAMRSTLVVDYDKLFAMLEGDRIDLAVVEYFDSLPTFKACDMPDVHVLEPPLAHNFMYHYLHEKHEKLVPRVNAVLNEMLVEGRLSAIRQEMLEEFRNR